jgi:predicted nucleic acid-binding protein
VRGDIVIVDTSVAIKWMVQEADSYLAVGLLTEWLSTTVRLFAPSLIVYEAANALYQHGRRGEIQMSGIPQAIDDLYDTGLTLDDASDATVSVRAIQIAQQFGLGPAYDTQFLALAEREDCEYWTADLRFWTTARASHPRVRWLGERAAAATP